MTSGKIEQVKKLREQANQLLAEVRDEEIKRIAAMREDLKKAERDFDKTYGIRTKSKKPRSGQGRAEAKVSANPLMDEEIIRIYESGLRLGVTDAKSLQSFLDPQLKRKITVVNKVVDAWNNASDDARSSPEKFVAFFKSSRK